MKFIEFPPGGGGHWLSHTLNSVRLGLPVRARRDLPHFHSHSQLPGLTVTHETDQPKWLFSSHSAFNHYINFTQKWRWAHNFEDFRNRQQEQFDILQADAAWRLSPEYHCRYSPTPAIDYSAIYHDHSRFYREFCDLARNLGILRQPEQSEIDQALDQFRSTCDDPSIHIASSGLTWRAWAAAAALRLGLDPEDITNREIIQYTDEFTTR